ncbi:MAG: PaaI family thioesterase [Pseudomonadota bacterium]
MDDIPEGFAPHFKRSAFTDPWEPIFSQSLPDRIRLGLRLAAAHCNSRGFVHGGLVASLADNAMGLSCAAAAKTAGDPVGGLVTVSLSVDYEGSAPLGAWLVVDTDHVKVGGSVCFARALVVADDAVVATAHATFKRVGGR